MSQIFFSLINCVNYSLCKYIGFFTFYTKKSSEDNTTGLVLFSWIDGHLFYDVLLYQGGGESSGCLGSAIPVSWSNFFHFDVVYGKKVPNNRLARPLGNLRFVTAWSTWPTLWNTSEKLDHLYLGTRTFCGAIIEPYVALVMQGLSVPFACVGSGDPVRVLRLYTTNTLDILWSIYFWDIFTTCRYQC